MELNMNGSLQALVATSKKRLDNLKEATYQKREEVLIFDMTFNTIWPNKMQCIIEMGC